ncbi:UNVERIFIED_CONTAM: hypothetical protein Cloal_2222 [Acetivibrio alkalicellulosi]
MIHINNYYDIEKLSFKHILSLDYIKLLKRNFKMISAYATGNSDSWSSFNMKEAGMFCIITQDDINNGLTCTQLLRDFRKMFNSCVPEHAELIILPSGKKNLVCIYNEYY